MISEFKNWRTRVKRSASGGFNAIWRGQVVCENGRVKKFESEDDTRAYLDRCDTAGRIIHRPSKRDDVRAAANGRDLEAYCIKITDAAPTTWRNGAASSAAALVGAGGGAGFGG